MINYKHHNPKQIVSTVAFVLERRLKLKVYEVRLSPVKKIRDHSVITDHARDHTRDHSL